MSKNPNLTPLASEPQKTLNPLPPINTAQASPKVPSVFEAPAPIIPTASTPIEQAQNLPQNPNLAAPLPKPSTLSGSPAPIPKQNPISPNPQAPKIDKPRSAPLSVELPTFNDDENEDNVDKTCLIDAPESNAIDEFLDNEKTQLNVSAMDVDPLLGKLIVESGKAPQREYVLARENTSIGRGSQNDIVIPDLSMSRKHAIIDKLPGGFRLKDLESGNGTILNGYRIKVGQLRNNDIIEIGGLRLRFEQSGGDPDELWKGEPKIEYHPKNRPPSSTSTPAVSPNSLSPHPQASPFPFQPVQSPQQPQMEPLIQRGGIPVQAWASSQAHPAQLPPMAITSAQMMAYSAAMNQEYKIPRSTWILIASIMIMTLLLLFVVALIIVKNIEVTNTINQINEDARKRQNIAMHIEQGATHFSNKQWEQALNTFQNLEKDAADNPIVNDYPVIKIYLNQIPIEQEREKELEEAFNKIKDSTTQLAVYEDVLALFNKIPDDSMFYHDIHTQKLPQLESRYLSTLKQDIQNHLQNNNIELARELLSKFDNIKSARVDKLNFQKIIDDAQKNE